MSLNDILRKHGFSCTKRYGQNFISDPNLLAAIASDGASKGDNVLEIGAGAGTLTAALCDLGAHVTAYEIDERLKPVLDEVLAGKEVRLIFDDAMTADIDALNLGDYRLVANLPYYITTPIIFRFLYDPHLLSLTVMVQKEVAERICAKPGTAQYGALSAQMQAMGRVQITRTVTRNMFLPAPDVDSAVVRLDVSPILPRENLPDYRKVVAAAFNMRRKTLVNNLCTSFPIGKSMAAEIVSELCGNLNVRGETLSPQQFIRLSELLKKAQ